MVLKHSKKHKEVEAKKPETAQDMTKEIKETMNIAKNLDPRAMKAMSLIESGYASYQKALIIDDMRKDILAMTDPVKKMEAMTKLFTMVTDAQLKVLEAKNHSQA